MAAWLRMMQILVVDDEPTLREFLVVVLTRAGYLVKCAKNGREALQILKHHSGEIQLMLTDLFMPGMTGDILALEVQKHDPNIRIIFMSGNSPAAFGAKVQIREGLNFLSKPFKINDLLQLLSVRCAAIPLANDS